MGWVTGIAVYVVLWWVTLFAVLPWGVRPAEDLPPGGDKGAPERPRMGLKVGVTTLVAALLWIGVELLVRSNILTFRPPS
jgi:predicted secreted protein